MITSFAASTLVALALLVPANTLSAQFIRFNLLTEAPGTVLVPQDLDFSLAEGSAELQERNDQGQVIALTTGACLRLTAVENIPVLVSVQIEDLRLHSGQPRPVSVEPRYINDLNPCPADIDLIRKVSLPFRTDNTAEFPLSARPDTRRSASRGATTLTAFVVLIGRQHLRPDAAILDQRQDLDYQGRYLLDITYL